MLANLPAALRRQERIEQPLVRESWLESGPHRGVDRDRGRFVPVSWDRAIELLADELQRVKETHGPQAIYGGSYGWASAGRFHHAQSQLHRFLNALGGYVPAVGNYSHAAGSVILRHVIGETDISHGWASWREIASAADVIVSFGGFPLDNLSVAPGGISHHESLGWIRAAAQRKARFIAVSPVRSGAEELDGQLDWLPITPGSDTALMLAVMHGLIVKGREARDFLATYCVGWPELRAYILGESDGTPKTAAWAAVRCGLKVARIEDLTETLIGRRVFVNVNWSVSRAPHGEQPVWAGLALACALGEVGQCGRGFGYGYCSMGDVGTGHGRYRLPTLDLGVNPVTTGIPVARVTEMLLSPGSEFDYDGQRSCYPDIRLVYWAGGNPFHHQQDLNRFAAAMRRPETIVVHEPYWTATAQHADIVIPSSVALERNDIGGSSRDGWLIAMKRVVEPVAGVRTDFQVFSELADRLGCGRSFHEGKDEAQWLETLYESWRTAYEPTVRAQVPEFDEFWQRGRAQIPDDTADADVFAAFRSDPARHALATRSGRIELASAEIESFGYADCPGHPTWLGEDETRSGEGRSMAWPLHLVASQPRWRLHSQLEYGAASQQATVHGHNPLYIHPADAGARGIVSGDLVTVENGRGSCLAGAVVTEDVGKGVVQLWTGGRYEPYRRSNGGIACLTGNPNVLTVDTCASRLSQGSAGAYARVEVRRGGAADTVEADICTGTADGIRR